MLFWAVRAMGLQPSLCLQRFRVVPERPLHVAARVGLEVVARPFDEAAVLCCVAEVERMMGKLRQPAFG